MNLIVTNKFDRDCAALADRHYPRRRHGNRQFMPPGETIVIRDRIGAMVFGWSRQRFRWDGERGFYCSIFRNESGRLSSEVILECERIAVLTWGQSRAFTYIDPRAISSCNPGFCFKCAGWKFVRENSEGKHVLEKLRLETPLNALSLGACEW
jgi:hypothetical protein